MSRLFFALWPDDETRAQINRVSQRFADKNCPLTRPFNLHITLVFLGEVPPSRQARLIAGIDHIGSNPFSLHLEKIGIWKRSGVLWLAPGKIPAALEHLVEALQRHANQQGISVDNRPYKPHVTLARKMKKTIKTRPSPAIHWPVEHFILAESTPTESGSVYRTLHKWPLKK